MARYLLEFFCNCCNSSLKTGVNGHNTGWAKTGSHGHWERQMHLTKEHLDVPVICNSCAESLYHSVKAEKDRDDDF